MNDPKDLSSFMDMVKKQKNDILLYKNENHGKWCEKYDTQLNNTYERSKVKTINAIAEAQRLECKRIHDLCKKYSLNNKDNTCKDNKCKDICMNCKNRIKSVKTTYKELLNEIKIICDREICEEARMIDLEQYFFNFTALFPWSDGLVISDVRFNLYGIGSLSTLDTEITDSKFTCIYSDKSALHEWYCIKSIIYNKINKAQAIRERANNRLILANHKIKQDIPEVILI